MSEIDAMKALEDAFENLDSDARERVLIWATSKFAKAVKVSQAPEQPTIPQHSGKTAPPKSSTPSKKKAGGSSGSGKKTIITMDKGLNLTPSGKKSALDFVGEKKPSNVKEKCVVAAYYLRDIIEAPNVNVSGVYTFFKQVSWPVPADLKNTLQQAGTEGWLDTADSDNILITPHGENLIEHSLPKKKE